MGLLLLLPLLVSGYLCCIYRTEIYLRLNRYEGQLLYLLVARYGLTCFLIALVSVSLMALLLQGWLEICVDWGIPICLPAFSVDFLAGLGSALVRLGLVDEDRARISAFLIVVGFATVLIPRPWAGVHNFIFRKKFTGEATAEVFILRQAVRGRPILSLLVESFALGRPVMLDMDSRKVYVGLVISLGSPGESTAPDEDLGILPLMSGYRDKDTLELDLNLVYPKAGDDAKPVFLRQADIVSVRYYDEILGQALLAANKSLAKDDFEKDVEATGKVEKRSRRG